MSKLLSETHPTLWNKAGSEINEARQDLWLSFEEDIQSCTVDRKEHEQTIDTINKNWIGYGKLCERKTLCRVREVLDKYMVPRGVYKELGIEEVEVPSWFESSMSSEVDGVVSQLEAENNAAGCGHSQCGECEYHCEPKSSNAVISDSCSHVNNRDCGDRSYCVDCREYIYDGHGESCEGSMCGCKGRRK